MPKTIGPKETALKAMREAREHPANVESMMLYGKKSRMGIVYKPKRKRDPMKIGKMSPSMAKALEIVERKKRI